MRILLSFILLTSSVPAWASFAFKQCATNTSCGGTASCATAAMGSALTSGSIILTGGVSTTTGTAFTASDTATNSYVQSGAGTVSNSSNGTINVLYSLNTHTTASNVVTVAQTSGTFFSVWACEYTGQAASSPIDGTCVRSLGSATAGTNNCTCSAAITPTGSDMIFMFTAPNTGPIVAGTTVAYTQRATAGGGQQDIFNISTAITPTSTDQDASTDPYAAIGLAIKPGATVNPSGINKRTKLRRWGIF